MRKSVIFAGLSALLVGFYACSSEPTPTTIAEAPYIAPPIPELDPAMQQFELDNEKPQLIKLANGGSIKFQPNSLVDSAGQPLKGKVNIKYREFHNAVDVMLSGIPMNYNENGQKGNFQTAGMFELRAEKDGKRINIAPDKPATVRMASYELGDDYDFFYLEEKNREGWKKKGHSKPEINVEKKKKVDKINSQLKTALQIDKKLFVFCFDAVIDASFKNDRAKVRDDASRSSISKTKANKYGIDQLALQGHQYINFQGKTIGSSLVLWKNLGSNFPDWTRKGEIWSYTLSPTKGNQFKLEVTHEGQKFETTIEAVMPLTSFFAFSPDHWKNNYQETYAKVQTEIERLRTEADAFRSFEISGIGIYNYDKLMNEADAIITKASFTTDAVDNAAYELNMVFYFADDKTLIKLDKSSWDRVALLPKANKARFVTILPNNAIGIFTAEEYQKIDFASLKKQSSPAYTFALTKKIDKLANAEQLAKELKM